MPLTGDQAAFHRFRRELESAGKPGSALQRAIMQGVRQGLQARIKDQFVRGVAPDDRPHLRRKDGKPALVSRRLGSAIRARVEGAAIWVEPKTAHVGKILDTQQDGHVFAGREGRVTQYRDKKGKIISHSKFLRRILDTAVAESVKGDTKRLSYLREGKKGSRFVASRWIIHRVRFGRRVLPARPIRPVGTLPPPWNEAIGRGVEKGMAARIGKYAE